MRAACACRRRAVCVTGTHRLGTVAAEEELDMTPKTERFEMRLDEELLASVDRWRAQQEDLPSRAEAMRRLVERGLTPPGIDTVKFSDGERLILMMMRDIYRHLKVEGEIDPEFVGEVISGGHYWAPKWEMEGLFHEEEDDPSDVQFVVDVMDMWGFLERGFEKLSKKDKERVEKETAPFGRRVRFDGFDGNNEASHLGIARFLTEKMKRFSEFAGRELNSHSPTLDMYSRMLAVFKPMRPTLVGVPLDASQIIRILKARAYAAK